MVDEPAERTAGAVDPDEVIRRARAPIRGPSEDLFVDFLGT
jgi:hypothetical protein